MTIRNLDHLVLTTQDLDACLRFYAGLLGMEHRVVNGQHALHFGIQKINLHTYAGEFQPAAAHPGYGTQDFCLIVDTPLEQVRQELNAAGWPLLTDIVLRSGALGAMRSLYMYDPDGNLVELAEYVG